MNVRVSRIVLFTWMCVWMGGVIGCSPVYETRYYYLPPSTEMGQMCLGHCRQTQMMCEQNCDIAEHNSRWVHSYDTQKNYYRPYRSFWRECMDRCLAGYNVCYHSCGGYIEYETYCVRNCPVKGN